MSGVNISIIYYLSTEQESHSNRLVLLDSDSYSDIGPNVKEFETYDEAEDALFIHLREGRIDNGEVNKKYIRRF